MIYAPSGRSARQEIEVERYRSAPLSAGSLTGPNKYWQPHRSVSADSALMLSNPDLLLARSQFLCDNDPLIYTIRERVVNHEIRNGAYPQFHFPATASAPAREINSAWESDFELWAEYFCHYADLYTYTILQRSIDYTLFSDGELFVRFYYDQSVAGVCPLRLSLLTVDHVDRSVDGKQADGAMAVKGVVFDDRGRFIRAHLFPRPPSAGDYGQKSEAVSADLLIHAYLPRHASQRRGRPASVPVMQLARDLDLYQDYTIQKAKFEASRAGYLEGGTAADLKGMFGGLSSPAPGTGVYSSPAQPPSWPARWDGQSYDGPGDLVIGGLSYAVLPAGAKHVDIANRSPSAQHEAFVKVNGRRIGLAAGAGELLGTGNYTDYTFAAAKSEAGAQAVDFFCKQSVLDDMVFKKIHSKYIDTCMLFGVPSTPLPDYYKLPQRWWIKIKTQWPGERSLSRYQDITAAEKAIGSNISTYLAEAAVEGRDYYENVEENKKARLAQIAAEYEILLAEIVNAELVQKKNALLGTVPGND